MRAAPILTEEELEKCENPYEEIEKMAKGLVEELKEKEYNRGYEKGMEDAWETLKKTFLPQYEGGLSIDELVDVFGTFAYKEAKEKIDNYIKKKNAEFHVGDEIAYKKDGEKLVIITMDVEEITNGTCFYAINDKGIPFYFSTKFHKGIIKKTGRHFDEVEELFKMMKED